MVTVGQIVLEMGMPRPPKAASPAPRRRKTPEPVEVSPRIARRDRRRERSRDEIVEAAQRVLVREGIAGTTLEAVAKEVGLTKAAIYYYFSSKDALLFELMYSAFSAQARVIHDEVEKTQSGGEAVSAIIRAMVTTFAPRMDDFRIAFLHGQLARPGSVTIEPEQFARIRPLNDLAYAGATKRLVDDWAKQRGRANVEPRIMAFLAQVAAIGLLTVKGMVESVGDPLLYSDEQLIDALSRIFDAAASP
jgi:AcrR family transcriptional regulator